MVLFRVNDGVTETVEELLAMPEEEVVTKTTMVAATGAAPGSDEYTIADLTAGTVRDALLRPGGHAQRGDGGHRGAALHAGDGLRVHRRLTQSGVAHLCTNRRGRTGWVRPRAFSQERRAVSAALGALGDERGVTRVAQPEVGGRRRPRGSVAGEHLEAPPASTLGELDCGRFGSSGVGSSVCGIEVLSIGVGHHPGVNELELGDDRRTQRERVGTGRSEPVGDGVDRLGHRQPTLQDRRRTSGRPRPVAVSTRAGAVAGCRRRAARGCRRSADRRACAGSGRRSRPSPRAGETPRRP